MSEYKRDILDYVTETRKKATSTAKNKSLQKEATVANFAVANLTLTPSFVREPDGDVGTVQIDFDPPVTELVDPLDRYLITWKIDGDTKIHKQYSDGPPPIDYYGLPIDETVTICVTPITLKGAKGQEICANVFIPGDVDPTEQPSTPTATPILEGVKLNWNGLDIIGNPMESDFHRLDIYSGTVDDFDPDTQGTLQGQLIAGGTYTMMFPDDVGELIWFRTVAIDRYGNESVPSTAVSATPFGVSTSDGNPPSVAPVLAAQGGIASALLTWEAIANADGVRYHVYASYDDSTVGTLVDPSNHEMQTGATFAIVQKIKGDPTPPDIPFWVCIVPEDDDGFGPASNVVEVTPIYSDEVISAQWLIAQKVYANQIYGEEGNFNSVIAGAIWTAVSGARSGLSKELGFASFADDNKQIFSVKDGDLSLIGRATLNEATFDGTVDIRALLNGATGGGFELSDQLDRPGSAPTVEVKWDQLDLEEPPAGTDFSTYRKGIVYANGSIWIASSSQNYEVCLLQYQTDGTFVARHDHATVVTAFATPCGIGVVGTNIYVKTNLQTTIARFTTSGASNGTITLSGGHANLTSFDSVFCCSTTHLFVAYPRAGDVPGMQKFTTAGALADTEELPMQTPPRFIAVGTFDYGVSRCVAVDETATAFAFPDNNPLFVTDKFLTTATLGFTWDGSRFVALQNIDANNVMRLIYHTDNLVDQGETAYTYLELTRGHDWYDSSAPVHNTSLSPSSGSKTKFYKRAKHRLTSSSPVPILHEPALADDPNGARFYVGRNGSFANMEYQGVHTPGAGEICFLEIDALTIPAEGSPAVNPAPDGTEAPFPASTPFYISTRKGGFFLDGSGDGTIGTGVFAQTARPVGEVTAWASATHIPDGWLVCDGSTFSATTYPQLAIVLADQHGFHSGDNYVLPDYRNRMLAGVGSNAGVVPAVNEGDTEANRTMFHDHGPGTLQTGSPLTGVRRVFESGANNTAGDNHTHNVTSGRTGQNMGWGEFPHSTVYWIIRAAGDA